MTTRAQFCSLLVLTLALLIAGLSGMYGWTAARQRSAVAEQRNLFLLQSLRSTTENYLATGTSLDQMASLQGLIDRERVSFPEVLAIDVFSAAGRVLYSTDPSSRGSLVPADWVAKLEQTGSWETLDPSQDQMGMRFENDLGRAAGGIVLTLVPQDRPWTLVQWREAAQDGLRLLALCLGCMVLASLLALLGLRRLLQPYRRASQRLEHAAGDVPLTAPRDALEHLAARAIQRLDGEMAQTQQTLQGLQELDRAS